MALHIVFQGTDVSIGDNVRVAQKIKEGDKERIQNFEGVVIAIKGNSGERTVTVRRIATGGIGVEKVYPVDVPTVAGVKILKSAQVRRSKLYYLRKRTGKEALKLKDVNANEQPATIVSPARANRGTGRKEPSAAKKVAAS